MRAPSSSTPRAFKYKLSGISRAAITRRGSWSVFSASWMVLDYIECFGGFLLCRLDGQNYLSLPSMCSYFSLSTAISMVSEFESSPDFYCHQWEGLPWSLAGAYCDRTLPTRAAAKHFHRMRERHIDGWLENAARHVQALAVMDTWPSLGRFSFIGPAWVCSSSDGKQGESVVSTLGDVTSAVIRSMDAAPQSIVRAADALLPLSGRVVPIKIRLRTWRWIASPLVTFPVTDIFAHRRREIARRAP